MNEQKRFGEVSVRKLILEFSIPAVIEILVNTFYNIIDRMFIGHIPEVRNLAIAGVGIILPLMIVIQLSNFYKSR